EAEVMQREMQPKLPLLYSVQGYQWCDLKLDQGRTREVAARADYGLSLAQSNRKDQLSAALDTLSLGRAAHARQATDTTSAALQLGPADDGLRAAGHLQ